MAGFTGMLELYMVALAADLSPALGFQALDDFLAIHDSILHTNTHQSKVVFLANVIGNADVGRHDKIGSLRQRIYSTTSQ